MFWECSLSFSIVQPPLLHIHLSLFPFYPSLPLSGVVSLSQALCSSDEYSNSLLHLDLSKNPGVLSGEDASVRKHNPSGNKKKNTLLHLYTTISSLIWRPFLLFCFQNLYLFLSQPNCLVHLDLSGTDCSVDSVSVWTTEDDCATFKRKMHFCLYKSSAQINSFSTLCLMQLFGALLRGCCADLSFLNLSKNSFSHRLVTSLRLPRTIKGKSGIITLAFFLS